MTSTMLHAPCSAESVQGASSTRRGAFLPIRVAFTQVGAFSKVERCWEAACALPNISKSCVSAHHAQHWDITRHTCKSDLLDEILMVSLCVLCCQGARAAARPARHAAHVSRKVVAQVQRAPQHQWAQPSMRCMQALRTLAKVFAIVAILTLLALCLSGAGSCGGREDRSASTDKERVRLDNPDVLPPEGATPAFAYAARCCLPAKP